MMLALIDVVLILILAGFVFYGLFFGLIRSVGVLAGVVAGIVLASRFYLFVFSFLDGFFFGFDNLGKVFIYFVLFSLISKLVSFLFVLLDKTFNIFSIIPFLKTINKIGGVIFGLFSGSLTIGIGLFVISKYAFIDNWVGKWLVDSQLAQHFVKVSDFMLPLLPEMLKTLNGLI